MMTVRTPTSTRLLLASGVIAGPFFTLAWLLESSTRSDYDPMRHPISSLSIGAHGWTQSVAFIVTGLLMIAFAIGLRRVLLARGRFVWAPRLIAAIGVGLLGAGFFVADPSNGYPLGTPALPLQYTLPGRLHRLFSALVFLGIPLASFNLAADSPNGAIRGGRRTRESPESPSSRHSCSPPPALCKRVDLRPSQAFSSGWR
jgi:hypothetical protein